MKRWPWHAIVLWVVIAVGPLALYLIYGITHNFTPLSMQIPLRAGQYRSGIFKTNIRGSYELEFELRDPAGRYAALSTGAILDLDWKIVDTSGAAMKQGNQSMQLGPLHGFTLVRYTPTRGTRQRLIVDLHRDIDEPAGSRMTLYINSTDDSEGPALGVLLSYWWACIVGGAWSVILLVLLIQRAVERARSEKSSRTPQTP
jgi:hypothetical protein